ncbi:hypothetical protein F442_22361 [Phytophthora nicotianae P10297]|uniref:Uncharacterized protein n=1 Tax=Phytophthora nicotianae P10297 TaxID=1317064 RepID=W2Y0T0_PHYNI|nr:hypothetical protein F442_22361 [Phytophthora nicotianae P10297]
MKEIQLQIRNNIDVRLANAVTRVERTHQIIKDQFNAAITFNSSALEEKFQARLEGSQEATTLKLHMLKHELGDLMIAALENNNQMEDRVLQAQRNAAITPNASALEEKLYNHLQISQDDTTVKLNKLEQELRDLKEAAQDSNIQIAKLVEQLTYAKKNIQDPRTSTLEKSLYSSRQCCPTCTGNSEVSLKKTSPKPEAVVDSAAVFSNSTSSPESAEIVTLKAPQMIKNHPKTITLISWQVLHLK